MYDRRLKPTRRRSLLLVANVRYVVPRILYSSQLAPMVSPTEALAADLLPLHVIDTPASLCADGLSNDRIRGVS
jgi:hypothetical protein